MDSRDISTKIEINQNALVDKTLECILDRRKELARRYNREQIKKSRRDLSYIYDYLGEALYFDEKDIFIDFVTWLKGLFRNIGLDEDVVFTILECISAICEKEFSGGEAKYILNTVNIALNNLEESTPAGDSYIHEQNKNSHYARAYLDLILQNRKKDAVEYILEQVSREITIPELYLDVFQVAQREIGRLWHENKISVAQEHYSSSVTQLIISQLYPRFLTAAGNKETVLTTAVGNELHEIGIRMVADLLEMEGYNTIHLGANTPTGSIIETIRLNNVKLLGVSVTLPIHLKELDQLVKTVRSDSKISNIKIFTGGYAFNSNPDLWNKFTVDAYFSDAAMAAARVKELMEE
ncbi:MAG: cobalamin B12-binding domain-containing protein [Halanaerobiales bacterium]